MQLTTFSDYALRVLMMAALHRDRLLTIAEISETYGISRNHLMKVVQLLGQLGVLETLRGKGGGLRLAGDPRQIVLGSVLRHTEGGQPLVECMGEAGQCRIAPACTLRFLLDEAREAFFAALDRHTLADIVADPAPLRELLTRPAPAGT